MERASERTRSPKVLEFRKLLLQVHLGLCQARATPAQSNQEGRTMEMGRSRTACIQ